MIPGLRALIAFAGLFALAGCVTPAAVQPNTNANGANRSCQVTYVVDGDTVHMACAGRGNIKARLLGYDTPEIFSPRCGKERAAGQMATTLLEGLVQTGPVTRADFRGHDRYGRDLVRLEIAGRDVARTMIATGYALPYSGGWHPEWCRLL